MHGLVNVMNLNSVDRPLQFDLITGDPSASTYAELKRVIRIRENIILCMEDDLQFSKRLCQSHAVSFWGPILERRWWEENGIEYFQAVDKLALLKKQSWECLQQNV